VTTNAQAEALAARTAEEALSLLDEHLDRLDRTPTPATSGARCAKAGARLALLQLRDDLVRRLGGAAGGEA
jgi:hypothetical protein